MPEIGKVFKACLVPFNDQEEPGKEVKIFDTNTSTKYWWDDFLELDEIHTNTLNTQRAYKKSLEVIDRYKAHKNDHTILRDTFTTRFRQNNTLDFPQFVDETLSKYQPMDPDLQPKLPKIIEALKKLPTKKGFEFDTQFTLSPSEVKFKRRKIIVNSEVDLTYKEGSGDLNSKIWSSHIKNVGNVIIIKSDGNSYKSFSFKPIEDEV